MPPDNRGGNSRQRKQSKKTEDRIAEEVTKRLLSRGETDAVPQAANSKERQSAEQGISIKQKTATFWASTPVWGGIAVLIGAIASQLSLVFLFFAVCVVFVVEFVR